MIKFMLILPIRWRRYWSRFSFVDEPTANPNRISSKQILELFQAVFWDVGHGTTENSSEIHTGTFVLWAQGRRDAKGGVNRSLHVFCVVVHPTDHYENHWISRQCRGT